MTNNTSASQPATRCSPSACETKSVLRMKGASDETRQAHARLLEAQFDVVLKLLLVHHIETAAAINATAFVVAPPAVPRERCDRDVVGLLRPPAARNGQPFFPHRRCNPVFQDAGVSPPVGLPTGFCDDAGI